MRHSVRPRHLLYALALLLVNRSAVDAGPVAESFAFSGDLAVVPGLTYGNGICDIRFSMFDAATGGNQVGGVEEQLGIPVIGHNFDVELNTAGGFGASALRGDQRWLQLEARCASSTGPASPGVPAGPFTVQARRLPLAVRPYAVWAKDAGEGLANLWNIRGNLGTDPTTNYLGTRDNKAFVIGTNGVQRVQVGADGRVGIGTSSPAGTLDVSGGTGSSSLVVTADTDGSGGPDHASLKLNQGNGSVSAEVGYMDGNGNLRLVNHAGGATILLKENGDLCMGVDC
jgi:hypothetical protein